MTWLRRSVSIAAAAVVLVVPTVATPVAAGAAACIGGRVGVPAKALPKFVPPHVFGDREFDGNGPAVRMGAFLWRESATGLVRVHLYMRAEETKHDWTRADGTIDPPIYDPPTGYKVSEASIPEVLDNVSYVDTDYNEDMIPPGVADGFVNYYEAIGDKVGDDAGVRTSVILRTKAFTLIIVEEDC